MFDGDWTKLPWLGVHVLVVVAAAWLGVRVRSSVRWSAAMALLAIAIVLVYGVLQYRVGASGVAFIGGKVAAELVVLIILASSSALAGQLTRRAGVWVNAAVFVGVTVGLLILSQLPPLQLRLGCGFTGICP